MKNNFKFMARIDFTGRANETNKEGNFLLLPG